MHFINVLFWISYKIQRYHLLKILSKTSEKEQYYTNKNNESYISPLIILNNLKTCYLYFKLEN